MRRALGLLLGMVLLASMAAAAADFWEKKKFTQWNEKEVQKMLSDSPWVAQRSFQENYASSLNSPRDEPQDPSESPRMGNVDESTRRDQEANPLIAYTVQLRSALPIRQALVRAAQLRADYEKMPAEQRQEFDKKLGQFLNARFDEIVVVNVSCRTTLLSDTRDLNQYWRQQTVDRLHNTTYLIGTDGRRVELKEFGPPDERNQTFQFVFPRVVDGAPIVSGNDKRLRLEFLHPSVRNQAEKRVLLEFKLDKMVLDGQLEY